MDVFEQLRAERVAILARLSKIEAVLTEHEALQQKVGELLGNSTAEVVPALRVATRSSVRTESGGRRVSADVADFERAIRDILRISPKPLNRHDLYDVCVERGINVGGQEPLNTLGARMSRMGDVSNVRGQGYFLKERLTELLPRAISTEQHDAQIALGDHELSIDEP